MTAHSRLARRVRSAVGANRITSAVRGASHDLRAKLQRLLGPHPGAESQQLRADGAHTLACEVLPGTPYTSVLLPLDYPPSRDYRPRWGASHPVHEGLRALFAERHDEYLEAFADMRKLADWFSRIKQRFTSETAPEPGWLGGPITALDSALVYYYVKKCHPRTFLEIGSGVTTCFARRAIEDHRLQTRIVSIDPSPRAQIDAICDDVVRDGLETVDLSIFERLQPGDIVFMDGSHRSFMNSDVTVFMLDVLPLLKPGVVVHIHDILLPYDYPEWAKEWYWNEQYLVAVYLTAARDRIQVLMPVAYLTRTRGLNACLEPPMVDLGADNASWRNGGSLWFTHSAAA